MSNAHHDVVAVGVPKQVAAAAAAQASTDMHFSETLYALQGASNASRANYLGDRQTFQAAFDHLVKLSTDATDKPLIAHVRSALAAFDSGDAKLLALIRANQSASAAKLIAGAQNDAADSLASAFDAYRTAAAADVAAQTKQFDSTASSAKRNMVLAAVLTLLALALAAGTAVVITRRLSCGIKLIKARIKQFEHAVGGVLRPGLEALAEGDLTVELEPATRPRSDVRDDEIGEILASAEQMREAVLGCYAAYNRSTETLRGLVG